MTRSAGALALLSQHAQAHATKVAEDKSRKQRSKPGMWPTLSTASSRRQGAQSTDDRVASATIDACQNFMK